MAEELLQLSVPRGRDLALEQVHPWVLGRVEEIKYPFRLRLFSKCFRGLDGLLPCVHEDHHLMALSNELCDLFEGGIVEIASALLATRLSFDADEVLLQRHRAKRAVEEEKALHTVDAEEVGNVDVVW